MQSLAQLIIQVRGEVIDRHEPEIGDTRLALGMRAYECCRSRITSKANGGECSWLSIITPQQRFTFAIDGVPVRFSRNDPDQLPDRKLVPSVEAGIQMTMFDNDYSNLRWFLVIDTVYDLPAEHVYFVGYNEFKDIVCKWEIPLTDTVSAMADINLDKPQPINIPPAKVKLKVVVKKEENKHNE